MHQRPSDDVALFGFPPLYGPWNLILLEVCLRKVVQDHAILHNRRRQHLEKSRVATQIWPEVVGNVFHIRLSHAVTRMYIWESHKLCFARFAVFVWYS
jgi:hypothetical protein